MLPGYSHYVNCGRAGNAGRRCSDDKVQLATSRRAGAIRPAKHRAFRTPSTSITDSVFLTSHFGDADERR